MRKANVNLNEFIENLLSKLSVIKTVYLVALCIIITILLVVLFSKLLFTGISNPLKFISVIEEIIVVMILGPVIETYLIQGFVLQKALNISGNNKFIAVLLSAMLFGLAHIYPAPPIALKAFFAGLLYAILFFAIQKKNANPLSFVLLAHAVYNLIVTCLNHIT